MMRLFVGLALPLDLQDRLIPMMAGLPGARWLSPSNLHLTLRFIGEADDHQAAILDDSLTAIQRPAFEIAVSGCGVFAQKRGPEAVWVGVAATPPLIELQSAVERATVRAGFAPEERRFRPHITLARLRNTPAPRLQAFVAGHNLVKFSARIDHFTLFSSLLREDGAAYTPEATYPLL